MPKIITMGEVMMRLTPPGFARLDQAQAFHTTFGGGEANVAMSLAQWGWQAAHVTRFPNHSLGYRALRFLREWGLDTSTVLMGGSRLGVYYTEVGASLRASQIVYDREGSAFAEIEPGMLDWEAIFTREPVEWFHWAGITPALSAGAAAVCLEGVKAAKKFGVKVSADVFYRSNLWKWGKTPQEILPELTQYCDLVVAGTAAIELIYGIHETDFGNACRLLQARYPNIQWITDTQRTAHSATHNELAATLWTSSGLWQTPPFRINPIIDRIGGGDAFIAGLLHGLSTFKDEQHALLFGVAASAFKHTIEGDINVVQTPEIEAIIDGDVSGRIKR